MSESVGDVFDRSRDGFAALGPVLWDPMGEAFCALSAPRPGDRVLDACCGAGASAVPAARAVGADGHVDAVDLSAGLLDVARGRAGDLPQLRLVRHDVTTWTGDEPYDVVQSGFGVFFLPDMDAATRRLAGLVRDGGRVAVQLWSAGALRGFARQMVAAIEHERGEPLPDRRRDDAARRLDSEAKLAAWLTGLGLADVTVTTVEHAVPLSGDVPWDLVRGTGFVGMLAGLDDAAVARVRADLGRRLAAEGQDVLDATSLVGVGRRG